MVGADAEGREDAPPLSIVRSKITRPTALIDVVERPGCAARVVDDAAPVAVIIAPAGYGKTTLLSEIVDLSSAAIAWVNVDAADNDPMRFWAHLSAALGDAGVDTIAVERAVRDGDDRVLDEIAIAVDRLEAGCLLILDDVHELTDDAIRAQVGHLLVRRPPQLRIAVASRSIPNWSIDRLRTRAEVVEIGVDDLALVGAAGRIVLADEISDGLIDESAADELVTKVEGWPAGLRLAKLALQAHARQPNSSLPPIIGGDQPTIARYLAGEVLSNRPAEEQDFLLTTSVLERLTPEACAAVSGRPDSLGLLRRFVDESVFTTVVDADGPVFAYHGLLREFLTSRLAERGADAVADVHACALTHAQSTHDTAGIVHHAVGCGRRDVALARLAEVYIDIANEGRIHELWSWVRLIGAEHVLAHPMLSSAPAWASLNRRRYDEIEPWLESFELLDEVSDAHRRDFRLHAAAIRSHRDRHLGDLDGAREHGGAGVALLDGRSTNEVVIAASVVGAAGAALVLTGELEEGGVLLRRALELGDTVGERSSTVFARGHLALALHMSGDDESALVLAEAALAAVDSPALERFHVPSVSWFVRGSIRCGQGRVGDAASDFARAQSLATTAREPVTRALIDCAVARRHHLLGDNASCREALRNAERSLAGCTGASWAHEQIRATHAVTRFAPMKGGAPSPTEVDLSPRESAVLALLPHELTRRELASQLFVSENTVKTHLTSIRHKLGVPARGDIVERARALGLLVE